MDDAVLWTQAESSQKLAVVDKDKPLEQQPLQLAIVTVEHVISLTGFDRCAL